MPANQVPGWQGQRRRTAETARPVPDAASRHDAGSRRYVSNHRRTRGGRPRNEEGRPPPEERSDRRARDQRQATGSASESSYVGTARSAAQCRNEGERQANSKAEAPRRPRNEGGPSPTPRREPTPRQQPPTHAWRTTEERGRTTPPPEERSDRRARRAAGDHQRQRELVRRNGTKRSAVPGRRRATSRQRAVGQPTGGPEADSAVLKGRPGCTNTPRTDGSRGTFPQEPRFMMYPRFGHELAI